MLNFIEIVIALSLIFILVPQTPTDNIVLRFLSESGLFAQYRDAKQFLLNTTWILIFSFLVLLVFLNVRMS